MEWIASEPPRSTTALRTVVMALKAGEVDAGLAVGVEKLAGDAGVVEREVHARDRTDTSR